MENPYADWSATNLKAEIVDNSSLSQALAAEVLWRTYAPAGNSYAMWESDYPVDMVVGRLDELATALTRLRENQTTANWLAVAPKITEWIRACITGASQGKMTRCFSIILSWIPTFAGIGDGSTRMDMDFDPHADDDWTGSVREVPDTGSAAVVADPLAAARARAKAREEVF